MTQAVQDSRLNFGHEISAARPPLRYHGGKWRLAPWIVSFFPPHNVYAEVFGGAAGVLLRKARSRVEVYNDLDSQVFNLFSLLRSQEHAAHLARLIALTPYSREEFKRCYEASDDPVEAARRFVFRCYAGFGTAGSIDPRQSNGFRSGFRPDKSSYAREWTGISKAIAAAASRLQGVIIENLHFRALIPKFDSHDTLFYADPPYPESTRDAGGKGYVREMTVVDHRQLAWILRQSRGKVIISGYDCALYEELYPDWRREEKITTASGQNGATSRTEVLWMNF